MLDNLFNVMFLLDDVPARCELFYESDWREARRELDRVKKEYGHSRRWRKYILGLDAYTRQGLQFLNLPSASLSNPGGLRSWPNVGTMASYGISENSMLPPNREFMKFLHEHFYSDVSQQTHMGGIGAIKRSGFLINERFSGLQKMLIRNKTASLGYSMTWAAAIASEIEDHFKFGLKMDLVILWQLMYDYIEVAREIYDKRYKALLTL